MEMASRNSSKTLTAKVVADTAGITDEPGRSQSVRTLATSRIVVKKRKMPSSMEGRNDFECSRGDNSAIEAAAARSSAAAAIVTLVRSAAYGGSVHNTSKDNLSRLKTVIMIWNLH